LLIAACDVLLGLHDDIGFNFIKRCVAAVEARG